MALWWLTGYGGSKHRGIPYCSVRDDRVTVALLSIGGRKVYDRFEIFSRDDSLMAIRMIFFFFLQKTPTTASCRRGNLTMEIRDSGDVSALICYREHVRRGFCEKNGERREGSCILRLFHHLNVAFACSLACKLRGGMSPASRDTQKGIKVCPDYCKSDCEETSSRSCIYRAASDSFESYRYARTINSDFSRR